MASVDAKFAFVAEFSRTMRAVFATMGVWDMEQDRHVHMAGIVRLQRENHKIWLVILIYSPKITHMIV